MTNEPNQLEPTSGPIQIKQIQSSTSLREVFGPSAIDQAIRNAVALCWQHLPERERTPERVEQEILRLTQRALEDFKQDFHQFGFETPDTPGKR